MSELNEIQCEKASRKACPIVNELKARVRELEDKLDDLGSTHETAVLRVRVLEEENDALKKELALYKTSSTYPRGEQ